MAIGYDKPLYILPRPSRLVREGSVRFTAPLTPEQTAVFDCEQEGVYDGLKLALTRACRARPPASSLTTVRRRDIAGRSGQGYITACPAEKAARTNSISNTATNSRTHRRVQTDLHQGLGPLQPEDDEAMNRRQAARLKLLADYAHENGQYFMFDCWCR